MRLSFQLRFHTQMGQSLSLLGDHPFLGNGELEKAIPLEYLNEQFWKITLVLPEGMVPDSEISYNYILRNADGSLTYEWGRGRVINPTSFHTEEVLLIDTWNAPGFCENAFYTKPFKTVLLKANQSETRTPPPPKVTHLFKIKAPLLSKGQTLCILGNTPALGSWNTNTPILLNRTQDQDSLSAALDLTGQPFPLAYKYGVYDFESRKFIRYEDGPNRVLYDEVRPNTLAVANDGFAVLPATNWRGAGVAIPVFSLRSEKSFGVGEFTDLKLLADWCQRTGLKSIQLLPINDTIATRTSRDSYPYAAISAFALHPSYLNLSQVATGRNKPLLNELEEERRRLNSLEALDYDAVLKAKLAFLRRIYLPGKERIFRSQEYQRFFERNRDWLVPYAAFSYLRDRYATPDFNQWPAHRTYDATQVAALSAEGSPGTEEIKFYYFIQFHLHLQLKEATEYAHAQGVILKGDIPIGVSRHGVDAWQNPELFCMNFQAGAPPDPFAARGQNWEFPTYNWQRMKQDSFAWWKRRFEQMGEYFDAFRIDHILGFFRIWSIPIHAVEGTLGYFVPALPVQINEFNIRGIWFDRDRYTKPYLTDEVLGKVFGPNHSEVKKQFLNSASPGTYTLKPEFATQRQVERYFASKPRNEQTEALKTELYDLISDVILLEPEGSQGQEFHFRLGIEKTWSFNTLDALTQAKLRDVYVDYFFHRQDPLWKKEAMEKLPALKRSTDLLICGEDLGMVPVCVPGTMKELGLLSLEVQRMPKVAGEVFSRPKDAPYLSVITPSTHDMSTIRGWWKEDRKVIQKFYNQELGQAGNAPEDCEPWINKAIVAQHLASPAMWSIFQVQDLLGMDEQLRRPHPHTERINVPADPRHYWRYRMHLSLESLLQANDFNDELRNLIRRHGR